MKEFLAFHSSCKVKRPTAVTIQERVQKTMKTDLQGTQMANISKMQNMKTPRIWDFQQNQRENDSKVILKLSQGQVTEMAEWLLTYTYWLHGERWMVMDRALDFGRLPKLETLGEQI